ncbi:hypothetical protein B7P43_G07643 [Cryptotermes secundus]|uniref:Reverse transcriptase domain-containing protein n=1 Tax=Cryptotermes secundus TaxID=105785 RepID=A0A2J7RLD7_9NEOP|nr:hypothetical protein B7P43_G07643 [Cryptotermes secundus]
MIDRLIEIGRCYGMEMNVEKTKVMKISRQPTPVTIKIDQKQLENVKCFKYLGSLLTDDGRCTSEIECTTRRTRQTYHGRKSVQQDAKIQHYVDDTGARIKTLRLLLQKHLESFEMWCWRRMEKISWTDYVKNEEVLIRVSEQRNILHKIRKRKPNWIGHVLSRNCLLK